MSLSRSAFYNCFSFTSVFWLSWSGNCILWEKGRCWRISYTARYQGCLWCYAWRHCSIKERIRVKGMACDHTFCRIKNLTLQESLGKCPLYANIFFLNFSRFLGIFSNISNVHFQVNKTARSTWKKILEWLICKYLAILLESF